MKGPLEVPEYLPICQSPGDPSPLARETEFDREGGGGAGDARVRWHRLFAGGFARAVDVNARPTTSIIGITKVMREEIGELMRMARFEGMPEKVLIEGENIFKKEDWATMWLRTNERLEAVNSLYFPRNLSSDPLINRNSIHRYLSFKDKLDHGVAPKAKGRIGIRT